jgi:hypothetical protein
MISFIKKDNLCFGALQTFDDFDTSEASTDNDDAGFAQVRNARPRGDQFGHLRRELATERAQFTARQRELSGGQINYLNDGL